jgi:flavin reductase (DIM6/NTAB) family NADH-FMN oxidoreductase RutF
LDTAKVYRLIEPGPVVLLTTFHKGRANVMTMSWHMMVEFEPAQIACVVSSANHSYAALSATGACVIAVPAVELAATVVKIGNCSGRDLDKFEAFALTRMRSDHVAAPLIRECFANLECRVIDRRLVRRFNLFILEVVKAWTAPEQRNPKTIHHHGYGKFAIDGDMIKLRSNKK